jgi:hypothetical protein
MNILISSFAFGMNDGDILRAYIRRRGPRSTLMSTSFIVPAKPDVKEAA